MTATGMAGVTSYYFTNMPIEHQLTGGCPDAVKKFLRTASQWVYAVLAKSPGTDPVSTYQTVFRMNLKEYSRALTTYDSLEAELGDRARLDHPPTATATLSSIQAAQAFHEAVSERFLAKFGYTIGYWQAKFAAFGVIDPSTGRLWTSAADMLTHLFNITAELRKNHDGLRWTDEQDKVWALLNLLCPAFRHCSNWNAVQEPLGRRLYERMQAAGKLREAPDNVYEWMMVNAEELYKEVMVDVAHVPPRAKFETQPGVRVGAGLSSGSTSIARRTAMMINTSDEADGAGGSSICEHCEKRHPSAECWSHYPWTAPEYYSSPANRELYRHFADQWLQQYNVHVLPYGSPSEERQRRLREIRQQLGLSTRADTRKGAYMVQPQVQRQPYGGGRGRGRTSARHQLAREAVLKTYNNMRQQKREPQEQEVVSTQDARVGSHMVQQVPSNMWGPYLNGSGGHSIFSVRLLEDIVPANKSGVMISEVETDEDDCEDAVEVFINDPPSSEHQDLVDRIAQVFSARVPTEDLVLEREDDRSSTMMSLANKLVTFEADPKKVASYVTNAAQYAQMEKEGEQYKPVVDTTLEDGRSRGALRKSPGLTRSDLGGTTLGRLPTPSQFRCPMGSMASLRATVDHQALTMVEMRAQLDQQRAQLDHLTHLVKSGFTMRELTEPATAQAMFSADDGYILVDNDEGRVMYGEQEHPSRGLVIQLDPEDQTATPTQYFKPKLVMVDGGSDLMILTQKVVEVLGLWTEECAIQTHVFGGATYPVTSQVPRAAFILNRGMEDQLKLRFRKILVVPNDSLYDVILGAPAVNSRQLKSVSDPSRGRITFTNPVTGRQTHYPVCNRADVKSSTPPVSRMFMMQAGNGNVFTPAMYQIGPEELSPPQPGLVTATFHEPHVPEQPWVPHPDDVPGGRGMGAEAGSSNTAPLRCTTVHMFLEHLIRYPGLRVFLKHEHASLLCPITLSTPGVCPQSLYADSQDAEGQNKSMREILNHLRREISEVDISHLHMMARGQVPDLMTDIVPQTMAELVAHPLPFPPVIHNLSLIGQRVVFQNLHHWANDNVIIPRDLGRIHIPPYVNQPTVLDVQLLYNDWNNSKPSHWYYTGTPILAPPLPLRPPGLLVLPLPLAPTDFLQQPQAMTAFFTPALAMRNNHVRVRIDSALQHIPEGLPQVPHIPFLWGVTAEAALELPTLTGRFFRFLKEPSLNLESVAVELADYKAALKANFQAVKAVYKESLDTRELSRGLRPPRAHWSDDEPDSDFEEVEEEEFADENEPPLVNGQEPPAHAQLAQLTLANDRLPLGDEYQSEGEEVLAECSEEPCSDRPLVMMLRWVLPRDPDRPRRFLSHANGTGLGSLRKSYVVRSNGFVENAANRARADQEEKRGMGVKCNEGPESKDSDEDLAGEGPAVHLVSAGGEEVFCPEEGVEVFWCEDAPRQEVELNEGAPVDGHTEWSLEWDEDRVREHPANELVYKRMDGYGAMQGFRLPIPQPVPTPPQSDVAVNFTVCEPTTEVVNEEKEQGTPVELTPSGFAAGPTRLLHLDAIPKRHTDLEDIDPATLPPGFLPPGTNVLRHHLPEGQYQAAETDMWRRDSDTKVLMGDLCIKDPGRAKQMKDLVVRRRAVFAYELGDIGGGYNGLAPPRKIPQKPNMVARQPPRRLSYQEEYIQDAAMYPLLKLKLIERAENSTSAANPVFAYKKDADGNPHDVRVCYNYTGQNRCSDSVHTSYPMGEELFQQMGQACIFSRVDLRQGFWQLPLAEDSRNFAAFWWKNDLYRPTRVTFGLKQAPAWFQHVMELELGNAGLHRCCKVFIDDILIHSVTWEQHLKDVEAVFDVMGACNLKLHPEKSAFGASVIEFLGFNVSNFGLSPQDAKVKAFLELPPPKSLSDLQTVLGKLRYYACFVEHFSSLAHPMVALLKKDAQFHWSDDCQRSFERIKQEIATPGRALRRFDTELPIIVYTDFSATGLGAVLAQTDGNGMDCIVACISRSLNKHERNYSAFKGEMLAAVWAVRTLTVYLSGRHFTLVTDHRPLVYLVTTTNLTGVLARWACILHAYDMTIVHRAGTSNTNADVLSRFPLPQVSDSSGARMDEEHDKHPCLMLQAKPGRSLEMLVELDCKPKPEFTVNAAFSGIVLLELCAGICTGLEACLRNGMFVRRYLYCDTSLEAQRAAVHRIKELRRRYPQRLPDGAVQGAFTSLPMDIALVDKEALFLLIGALFYLANT